MMLGGMDVGLNTQNLVAILVVIALSIINIFGVKTGAFIQNIFTTAKVSALLGVVTLGVFLGRNARGDGCEFRRKLLEQFRTRKLCTTLARVLVSTLPCWRLRRLVRCFPPMPGTTSPSLPAK